jgi:alpha-beta hydrolase superfamily lysophospholipase
MMAGFFDAPDGMHLYREVHPSTEPPSRATLLVVHGYGEHCGRYPHVARYFTARGYTVELFDYRGHGQSAGKRGHIDSFEDYFGDLARAVELAHVGAQGRPVVLVGHSHGGLLATLYALARPKQLGGLVLSAPFFGLALRVPWPKRLLGRLFGRLWPHLTLSTGIDPFTLSRDRTVGEAYGRDRWVHRVATARWFTEVSNAQRHLPERLPGLEVPLLLLVAGHDLLTDSALARRLFSTISNPAKQLHVYDGLYHELFNEPEKERVLQDVLRWLDQAIAPVASSSDRPVIDPR